MARQGGKRPGPNTGERGPDSKEREPHSEEARAAAASKTEASPLDKLDSSGAAAEAVPVWQVPEPTCRGSDFTRLADVLAAAAQSIGAQAAAESARSGVGALSLAAGVSSSSPRPLSGEHLADRAPRHAPRSASQAEFIGEGRSRQSSSLGDRDLAREVAHLWPQVVGPEIAANATPVYVGRGRLVVSTSSSAWAQTLHLMSEDILARLNEGLGGESPGTAGLPGKGGGGRGGLLASIVFRHAGWEGCRERLGRPLSEDEHQGQQQDLGSRDLGHLGSREPGSRDLGGRGIPSGPDLSLEQQEALAAVAALDLPDDLKETMLRAMRAAFVRDRQDSVRS